MLHLGCGLDSRSVPVGPGPRRRVVRRRLSRRRRAAHAAFSRAEHCHVVAASVTDPAWLADVPADRPTLMIGEGLTMYLTKADGVALLRRIVEHAPSGELQFDAFSRFGIKTQWTNTVVKRAGATLYWGIDGPEDILDAVPGVRLLQWVSPFDSATFRQSVLALSGDGQGDVGVFVAALHGAVPPLRVLRTTLPEHRLTTATLVEIRAPRGMAPLVTPHKLQCRHFGTVEGDREIQVRIRLVDLHEFELHFPA